MAKTSKPEAAPTPQPPYIKRAHLRNVPPLRDVKVDFKPGLNIIIGKNGSGKTNFMKLLSELVDLHEGKFRGIGSKVDFTIDKEEIEIAFKESKLSKKAGRMQMPARNLPLSITAFGNAETAEAENPFIAIVALLASGRFGRWGVGYDVLPIWHGLPNHQLLVIDRGTDFLFDASGGMSIMDGPEMQWQQLGVLERVLINSMVPYDVGSPANHFASTDPGVVHKFITTRINIHLTELNAYLPT